MVLPGPKRSFRSRAAAGIAEYGLLFPGGWNIQHPTRLSKITILGPETRRRPIGGERETSGN